MNVVLFIYLIATGIRVGCVATAAVLEIALENTAPRRPRSGLPVKRSGCAASWDHREEDEYCGPVARSGGRSGLWLEAGYWQELIVRS
jgi:hypothetical protein